MDCRVANAWRSLFGHLLPGEGGVGEWREIRSGRPTGTAPYRMSYSRATTDVSRYHVDTTVPQLIADLCSDLPIKMSVELIAMAAVDGRRMMGDLLISFACIGRPQFVKAFKSVLMKNVPSRTDGALFEIKVAFVRC